jgi:hypothetical protein
MMKTDRASDRLLPAHEPGADHCRPVLCQGGSLRMSTDFIGDPFIPGSSFAPLRFKADLSPASMPVCMRGHSPTGYAERECCLPTGSCAAEQTTFCPADLADAPQNPRAIRRCGSLIEPFANCPASRCHKHHASNTSLVSCCGTMMPAPVGREPMYSRTALTAGSRREPALPTQR